MVKNDLISIALKVVQNTQKLQDNINKVEQYLEKQEERQQRLQTGRTSVKPIDRLSKGIKKDITRKSLDLDHPLVKSVSLKLSDYLGISAGTANALIKAGSKLRPMLSSIANQRQGYSAIGQDVTQAEQSTSMLASAEEGAVLAGETGEVVALAEVAEGTAIAAESVGMMQLVGAVVAPEILIPALGVGFAIKEIYDAIDDLF